MHILLVAAILLVAHIQPVAADLASYAIVNPDGTLKVAGRRVRLHGIYIPPSDRNCRRDFNPVICGSRAAVALELKIQSFVRCAEVGRNRDRSIDAYCTIDGDSMTTPRLDLGQWLIGEGWAVAVPEAPFEYLVEERFARARGKGLWGFPADIIR